MANKRSSGNKARNSSPRDTQRSATPSASKDVCLSLRSRAELFQASSTHRSFKRSYREGYRRDLDTPGAFEHVVRSFGMIFKNYKLFIPFLILMTIFCWVFISSIGELTKTDGVFGGMAFLIIWLVTIFLIRQKIAGHDVTLRDGLYNAMTPLLSTLVVFIVILIQSIPIFLLVIAYSSAIQTNFLNTPFYALLFFGFAGLMILMSGYLLSSSLIALVIVSAPGLYPLKALKMASELMMGRRIRFISRIIVLITIVLIMWGVIILPLVALKIPVEILSIVVFMLACFSAVYATTYLYIYYRWMLDYEKK